MFRFIFLILFVMNSLAFAQTKQSEEPIKIQDFVELGKANNAEVKAYFEDFFKTLEAKPDLQGYIINYGTAKQIAVREKITYGGTFSFFAKVVRIQSLF